MYVDFLGAAGTVTGSMHRLRTSERQVLLDCGLFQGRRRESLEKNQNLPVRAGDLDAVVLSHAHIDHSGALPLLVKKGYQGPIYCTPATRDLCVAMLEDSAMIQAADADYINRSIERDGVPMDPVEPLYDEQDVQRTVEAMIALPYHRFLDIAPGIRLTFYDAGHVLGSAIVALDVEEDDRRLVFTGDLGRRHIPILRDPEVPPGAHLLITESTYGDRVHDPVERMDDALAEVLDRTYRRGGKVIVPSFALERAQELVFALKRLKAAGRMPPMRVYVDSPLTVRLTDVFRMHPECYDTEARRHLAQGDSPFEFDGLEYISDPESSKAIDADDAPSVIISASGMCEAGRVLHHLKATVEDAKNTIVIVGWQAPHTLGRRLVEEQRRVRIFGVERDRLAEVVVLNGFSAHADREDLLDFAERLRDAGPLRSVALVHGEPPAQQALADALAERHFPHVVVPKRGDSLQA